MLLADLEPLQDLDAHELSSVDFEMLDDWVSGPGCSKLGPAPNPVASGGSHIVVLVEMLKMLEFDKTIVIVMAEQNHHGPFLLDVLVFSQSAVMQPQDSLRLQRPLVPAHQLKHLFTDALVQQLSTLGSSFECCQSALCSHSIFLPPSSIGRHK